MPRFEIDFKVLENEAESIIGVSLIASLHCESEIFCNTFPSALMSKKASIKFEGEEIIFDHPTCQIQGRCAYKLKSVDFFKLKELLSGKRELKILEAGILMIGFKIIHA